MITYYMRIATLVALYIVKFNSLTKYSCLINKILITQVWEVINIIHTSGWYQIFFSPSLVFTSFLFFYFEQLVDVRLHWTFCALVSSNICISQRRLTATGHLQKASSAVSYATLATYLSRSFIEYGNYNVVWWIDTEIVYLHLRWLALD